MAMLGVKTIAHVNGLCLEAGVLESRNQGH